jgi:hypothetical protein
MSDNRLTNKIKAIALLLATGLDRGEYPLDKLTTVRRIRAVG